MNERMTILNKKLSADRLFILLFTGLLVLTSLFILLPNLGGSEFENDEFQVINAAKGYLETGEFSIWDWNNSEIDINPDGSPVSYSRAWPHTFLVAQSFSVFGFNEASARLPSVIAGVSGTVIIFFFARYFTRSWRVGALSAIAFMLFPRFIDTFRTARMYSIVIPLFLGLSFLAFKAIENPYVPKYIRGRLRKLLEYLGIHFYYSIAFALLLIFGMFVHFNVIVIVPIIFIYSLFRPNERNRYIFKLISIVVPATLAVLLAAQESVSLVKSVLSPVGIRETPNWFYLQDMFYYPLSQSFVAVFGIPMFLHGIISRTNPRLLYLCCSALTGVIVFVFFIDRYPAHRYFYHLVPLAIVLTCLGVVRFADSFTGKLSRPGEFGLTLSVLLAFVISIFLYFNKFYPNYVALEEKPITSAYKVIGEGYNPETDLVMTFFPRDYYLQLIGSKITFETIPTKKRFSSERLQKILTSNDRVWFTFETTGHFQPEVLDEIRSKTVDLTPKDGSTVLLYVRDQSSKTILPI